MKKLFVLFLAAFIFSNPVFALDDFSQDQEKGNLHLVLRLKAGDKDQGDETSSNIVSPSSPKERDEEKAPASQSSSPMLQTQEDPVEQVLTGLAKGSSVRQPIKDLGKSATTIGRDVLDQLETSGIVDGCVQGKSVRQPVADLVRGLPDTGSPILEGVLGPLAKSLNKKAKKKQARKLAKRNENPEQRRLRKAAKAEKRRVKKERRAIKKNK